MSDAKTEGTTPTKPGATTPAKPEAAAPAKPAAAAPAAKPATSAKPEGTPPTRPSAARTAAMAPVRPEPAAPAEVESAAPVKPAPKPRPKPQPAPVVPAHSAEERRTQFVRVYLKHRVGERLDGFERGRAKYTSSRRLTGALSVVLLAGAAALGAIAAADASRRPMWGFLAAVAASLAVAVAWYESAFGLRRLARRSTSGAALLEILQAHGAPSDEDGVAAFVTEVESVLRHSD